MDSLKLFWNRLNVSTKRVEREIDLVQKGTVKYYDAHEKEYTPIFENSLKKLEFFYDIKDKYLRKYLNTHSNPIDPSIMWTNVVSLRKEHDVQWDAIMKKHKDKIEKSKDDDKRNEECVRVMKALIKLILKTYYKELTTLVDKANSEKYRADKEEALTRIKAEFAADKAEAAADKAEAAADKERAKAEKQKAKEKAAAEKEKAKAEKQKAKEKAAAEKEKAKAEKQKAKEKAAAEKEKEKAEKQKAKEKAAAEKEKAKAEKQKAKEKAAAN